MELETATSLALPALRPSFSVVIPVADNASPCGLESCVESVERQTLPPKQIIVVVGPTAAPSLLQFLDGRPGLITLKRSLGKSVARNLGASLATGDFLVHLDVDTRLEADALESAAELADQTGAKAIVLAEKVLPANLVTRAKCLERRFNAMDSAIMTPQVIDTDLFKRIGGYDESVEMLDDWTLHFRLKRAGVSFYFTAPKAVVDEAETLPRILKRKYVRGRYIPMLKSRYPEFGGLACARRLAVVPKNWRLLLEDPLAAAAFLLEKPLEWIALLLGSRSPVPSNIYCRQEVAAEYDHRRSSSKYERFKNYTSEECLRRLMEPLPGTVLEIGAGTGRITRFLRDLGIAVLATEPSAAMLGEYLKKENLPPPVRLAGEEITPELGTFDAVLGIRVLWHIRDGNRRAEILRRATLVARGAIIFDFANARKYNNPVLWAFFRLYGLLFNPNFYRNDCFSTLEEIATLAEAAGLSIERVLPLDVLTPVWLNLLPRSTAEQLYPALFSLEQILGRVLPPGRLLVKFGKIPTEKAVSDATDVVGRESSDNGQGGPSSAAGLPPGVPGQETADHGAAPCDAGTTP